MGELHASARLAEHALAFQRKLAAFGDHVDPRRLSAPGDYWTWLGQLPDAGMRQRIAARLFERSVAVLPPLERLADRHARVVLLSREVILRQFCTLALARRPGALRCCIDRDVRAGLREALGPNFEILAMAADRGRPLGEPAVRWTPMHWSCLGYIDWSLLLQRDDQALRRIARMSLPRGLLGMNKLYPVARADLKPARAVALMDELGLEWSC
jgi:hypothetical protein